MSVPSGSVLGTFVLQAPAEEHLGIETFRTPFPTPLKQEFWAEFPIQVVSQVGPSGGRQKGKFGIIRSLNCALCLELENPGPSLVVLYH